MFRHLNPALTFTREHLRAPLTLALLTILPLLFVLLAADVLNEFAAALGGSIVKNAATALGAGWSAAFVSGALGFFAVSSSRHGDRRLSLAGLASWRVAGARIMSCTLLAAAACITAFVALALETNIRHPWHTLIAIGGYALIYISVGVAVGSVIKGELEGSLTVAMIFLLDVFSGPGMTEGNPGLLSISRKAGVVLIDASVGTGSSNIAWMEFAISLVAALALAFGLFIFSSRPRK